ncbi:MAG: antiterminator LoaP [Coprococcus sp.]
MKGAATMWYVIQVTGGQEHITKELMMHKVSAELLEECFIPMRERRIKYQGSWKLVKEKLFPGYVFVVTDAPDKIYEQLKGIARFTRLLGNTDAGFIALSPSEVEFIKSFGDEEHISHLSQIEVSEGNQVRIVSGPLLNQEGRIVKINLHKRIAVVRVEFMGRGVDVYMGIEVLEKV